MHARLMESISQRIKQTANEAYKATMAMHIQNNLVNFYNADGSIRTFYQMSAGIPEIPRDFSRADATDLFCIYLLSPALFIIRAPSKIIELILRFSQIFFELLHNDIKNRSNQWDRMPYFFAQVIFCVPLKILSESFNFIATIVRSTFTLYPTLAAHEAKDKNYSWFGRWNLKKTGGIVGWTLSFAAIAASYITVAVFKMAHAATGGSLLASLFPFILLPLPSMSALRVMRYSGNALNLERNPYDVKLTQLKELPSPNPNFLTEEELEKYQESKLSKEDKIELEKYKNLTTCPISLQVCKEPVTIEGHIYEKSEYIKWVEQNLDRDHKYPTDPRTRKEFKDVEMKSGYPNNENFNVEAFHLKVRTFLAEEKSISMQELPQLSDRIISDELQKNEQKDLPQSTEPLKHTALWYQLELKNARKVNLESRSHFSDSTSIHRSRP